jgi:hypothetical protein
MGAQFEIAGGTVTGREHYRLRANGQDAYAIVERGEISVGVVCDGCGDPGSKHSEVGAGIGARVVAHRLASMLGSNPGALSTEAETERTLERVRRDLVASLRKVARTMSDQPLDAVSECLLFTVVGCAITRENAAFFSQGDGVIAVNEQVMIIGPYPDNAPPYVAYALLPECQEQGDLRFTLHAHMRTEGLDSFMIGSDGVQDLIEAGEIDSFRADPLSYANPYSVSNRLRLLNTERTEIDWEGHRKSVRRGVLADDTTLIVGRKR